MRGASAVLFVLVMTLSRAAGGAALSPRIANYTINATYDPAEHTVTGHEILDWRNSTHEAALDLYFHLYLNAFANNRSSFVREAGEAWVDWTRRHAHGWGFITVTAIRIAGADVTARMQFVHPDDDNNDDRTVFRLPLDTPLPPGHRLQVEIDFTAKLPKVVARSGYAGPFAFVAQWFPKIGVYEDGAWNCHQYHATTEFFADFGVYDVTLTVPRDGIVGATGTLQQERDNGDRTKTITFRADDVHDFAWTIDPRFQVVEDHVRGTTVRLLLQPDHLSQAGRHLQAAKTAIEHYADWIGEYPYPQLTIVDPGPGGSGAGGMEYPTLITVGTAWWMPAGLRLPEFVTVHEFGHQYWYGMLASNEFEEAWLDEGVNSWMESSIMDAAYGAAAYIEFSSVRFNSVPLRRWRYLVAASHDPMVRPAWQFLDRSSYSAISYAKTALVFDTLDAYLGNGILRNALAAYYQQWRFRHPHGGDLLRIINDHAHQDLNWYFDQTVSGTGTLDYAVTRVNADETHGFAGYPISSSKVGEELSPGKTDERRYRSEVVVERLGAVLMPVDVQIRFDDGTGVTEHWDGRDRWKRFEYTGTQRVEWAVVDPNHTMPLDTNWLNNSRMREAGTRGLARIAPRWGFWFQNLIYFLTGL